MKLRASSLVKGLNHFTAFKKKSLIGIPQKMGIFFVFRKSISISLMMMGFREKNTNEFHRLGKKNTLLPEIVS